MTDQFLWLEDVLGDEPLEWVRARNADTIAELDSPRFTEIKDRAREILDSDDRIPYARRRGKFLYNFWRDATHPRGLWRRTTLESYREAEPEWELLLDVDALAEAEGENWVWAGASLLRPIDGEPYRHTLISLSRGGADAAVVREFDLTTRTFVTDGFTLPEAKSTVGWIDEDTLFVGTDTGPGSLTESGYPRTSLRWRRGTPLTEAELAFAGEASDVAVHAWRDRTPGYERTFADRATDFFHSEQSELLDDGTWRRIDTPADARLSVHQQWLVVFLRSPWLDHAAGTLLVINYDEFVSGARDFVAVFTPDAHTSLSDYAWTKSRLLLVVLHDVVTQVLSCVPGQWQPAVVTGLPEGTTSELIGTNPLDDDEAFLNTSGFLTPATLFQGDVTDQLTPVKSAPERFDATGLRVEQFFATSADGTAIPYFVVGAADRSGPGPTLLGGYGGFGVSRLPSYAGVLGSAWLERGGTYVLANIRGGGEYGPTWHTQAQLAGRHKVAEDFAAVAADLVTRGIATPETLGAQGGSNGGLLMGIMATKYPQLFGAIVCQVPLLDMRRYHLLLAGASWMAEYGDPDDLAQWEFISAYSPYQNTDPDGDYPPILFTTSTRDDRVHPGHARKMMALLREQGHRVWYYENIEGGHGGAADNEQAAFASALAYEFLWEQLT